MKEVLGSHSPLEKSLSKELGSLQVLCLSPRKLSITSLPSILESISASEEPFTVSVKVIETESDLLARVQDTPIDVVFIEVDEDTNIIRQISKLSPHTKIAILTHTDSPTIVSAAMRAGASYFLSELDTNYQSVEMLLRQIKDQLLTEHDEFSGREKLQRQNRILVELAGKKTVTKAGLKFALQETTEAATQGINVERVSVWKLSEDRSKLICLDLFERSSGTHSSGQVIEAKHFPAYFRALETSRIISASNVFTDHRTKDFSNDYLIPNKITSMLDACIRTQTGVYGAICIEHTGPRRDWSIDEEAFAGSLADAIRIAIEIDERTKSEQALEKIQEKVETVVANAPLILFSIDKDGVFTLSEGKGLKNWGLEPGELVGQSINEVYKDRPDILLQVKRALEGHEFKETIAQNNHTYEVNYFPLRDEDSNVKGVIGYATDISDKKRVQDALEKQRSFFREVIDINPNFIFAKDRDGRFVLVNKAVAEAYGTTVDNLLGRRDSDFNEQDEEVDHFREDDRYVIDKQKELFIPEEEITTADGERRFLQTVKKPLVDDSGEAKYVLGVATDITARKNLEEVLKSRVDLENLISKLSAKFISAPSDKVDESINQALEEIGSFLGVDMCCVFNFSANLESAAVSHEWGNAISSFSFKELLGLNSRRFPWAAQKVLSLETIHFSSLTSLPETAEEERRLCVKNGIQSFLAVPMVFGGKPVGALAFCSISKPREWGEDSVPLFKVIAEIFVNALQRKQVEKTLREHAALLDLTQEAILVRDLDGHIRFWNKGAENLYGWAPAEALGQRSRDLLFRENHDELNRADRILKETGHWQGEVLQKTKDGQELIVESRWTLVRDKNGEPKSILVVNSDITKKKQWEDEMMKATKLESIGLLAGGIAHDFNNILTAIIGNISLAKRNLQDANKSDELLSRAEKATERAKDLTHQLLTFAKGGAPIKKVVCLREILKENVDFSLHGSSCSAEFNIPEDGEFKVEADPGQLGQVFNNLIINATQAMPNGGKIVVGLNKFSNSANSAQHISALPDGDYYAVSFKDEGCGISTKNLNKIFDPYFTTKDSGNGLGLSTVYSIINQHQGHILVDSQLGFGTTFTAYLPASSKRRNSSSDQRSKITRGQGNILVMDDDEIVLEIAAELLEDLGYKVTCTLCGEDAIEAYKHFLSEGTPFDAIIMDLTVPGKMGGKEALEQIKTIDPAVKAVVSSGYSNDPVMANYQKYGFCGVVAKPYELEELGNVIHAVLEDKSVN